MSDTQIEIFGFHESVVPDLARVINSEGLDMPLHMLPSVSQTSWSFVFDELLKIIVPIVLKSCILRALFLNELETVIAPACLE